ncbi:MAG: carbohydrate ABC transporter permease [Atopococcus tabaci]|uniref:Carbohydrate ABC transporter permease n=1 Tax=Atopococcus tabaci TaxID=269774 RepID=A0AA43UCN5_9LACT|nr:carbohydrate ABC transporter permease [Atopococcus tabaci]
MNNKTQKIIRTIIALILVFLLIFPVFILLNSSLQTYEQIRSWPPQWFTNLQWSNFVDIFQGNQNILRPLLNSLYVSTLTMILCVIVGSLASYAVSRFNFKGNKAFLMAVILTQMFSPVILVTPMYTIFRDLNLLNSLNGLVIANTATALPMSIWLLYSFFTQVSKTYEEAAWMDGSSRLQAIKNVVIPISMPGIITAGLFAFITAWGDIVFVQSFITNADLRTMSLALLNFQDLYKTAYELQMAASVVSSIPTVIIFLAIQKYLVRGMSNQGLKG